jgi:glycosyltransferase involved in cell wall biosynthesis
MMPLFSVVMPTYRRPHLLARCLAALGAQAIDRSNYEIIVADDAASEETRQQVEAFASQTQLAVRYIAVSGRHGPAAARNAGWRAAQGRVIAFTDDDCVPDPGWLAGAAAAFERGATDAAWGRLIMPLPPDPTDYERDAAGLSEAVFVTANCFCRRDVLQKIGGFDEEFAMAWREDSDLYFSLVEHGCHIQHLPEAIVVHPIRPAGWGVSLKQQRKTMFDALLYKKHPRLYRRYIGKFPSDYYIACIALLGIVTGILWQSALAVGVCALIWLAVTGQFYWRRIRNTSQKPGHLAEMLVTSVLIPPISTYWHWRGALRFRVFYL